MPQTRNATQAAAGDLNTLIPEAAALDRQIEDLEAIRNARKAAILSLLQAGKLDRYATPDGFEAVQVTRETLAWDTTKLKKTLDPETFAAACPPKPDTGKLKALLELGTHKGLAKCAETKASTFVTVRSPKTT